MGIIGAIEQFRTKEIKRIEAHMKTAEGKKTRASIGQRPIGASDIVPVGVVTKPLALGLKAFPSITSRMPLIGKAISTLTKKVPFSIPKKTIAVKASVPAAKTAIGGKTGLKGGARVVPGAGGMASKPKPGIVKQATGVLGGLKSQFDKLPAPKKIAAVAGGVAAIAGTAVAVKSAADALGITKKVTGLFGRARKKRAKAKRRVSSGRRTKRRVRRSRRRGTGRRKAGRVSFITRDGRRVSFTPRGKRRSVRKRSRRSWLADRRQVSKEPWEQAYQRRRRKLF